MKNNVLHLILLSSVIPLFFASCKTKHTKEVPEEVHKEELVVTPRNTAITPANAYNDLFLDSSDVNKFIGDQKMDDKFANYLRNFYLARNFQFAWFDTNGLDEEAFGFRSLYDYVSDTSNVNKPLEYRLDAMMTGGIALPVSARNPMIVNTELQLTQRFIDYCVRSGNTAEMASAIPMQRGEILQKAEAIIAKKPAEQPLHTYNNAYNALSKSLKQYTDIAKNGGWDAISADKKRRYKKGDQAPVIAWVKKRLQTTAEFDSNDTSAVFNDSLEEAIRSFEVTHGHTPKGIITDTLLREMNIPAIKLVECMLINLERMRWVPPATDGRSIMVNIPEFTLHVWNGPKKDFDMPVVVGKAGTSTTMFAGKLNQIVFSPYWNIPNSIVRQEVLRSISRNKNYLRSRNMEVVGRRNGLPVIRQRPGRNNPLGRVKFLFPNSYSIYFHDTNQKSLFSKDQRAFSHGCIRLGNPVKLANYLLEDVPEWSSQKIENAMNSGKQRYVSIHHPVPVLITYYTAWVDERDRLNFRKDIYNHDSFMAEKLFATGKEESSVDIKRQ
jgi:murein L,D-transpeptidase YcbB/YkuD